MVERLDEIYPETPVPLNHKSKFELIIAVLLSAQCTDERVNQVTPQLFSLADNPLDMSKLQTEKIYEIAKNSLIRENIKESSSTYISTDRRSRTRSESDTPKSINRECPYAKRTEVFDWELVCGTRDTPSHKSICRRRRRRHVSRVLKTLKNVLFTLKINRFKADLSLKRAYISSTISDRTPGRSHYYIYNRVKPSSFVTL